MRVQDHRFLSLGRRPKSFCTAFMRQHHQPPTSTRRQPASRAAPLDALGRRLPSGRHRERGGAAIGVSRSTLTGSLSAAAATVGTEPSSSAAVAAAAAAVRPLVGLSQRRERCGLRRRTAARRGATRPSGVLQVSMRWLGRRQRSPAYVRQPCRCSALACAHICSCSRRADRRCRVCMCVCQHPAGSREMGTDAAPCSRAGYISAVFNACAHEKYNFEFRKLTRLIQPRRSPSTA